MIPSFGQPSGSAIWGDATTFMPWNMYWAEGDPAIIAEHFDAMCGWVDWLERIDGDDVRATSERFQAKVVNGGLVRKFHVRTPFRLCMPFRLRLDYGVGWANMTPNTLWGWGQPTIEVVSQGTSISVYWG